MVLCYISMNFDIWLFPDAKLPKYIPQNFIGAYLPDDFPEVI